MTDEKSRAATYRERLEPLVLALEELERWSGEPIFALQSALPRTDYAAEATSLEALGLFRTALARITALHVYLRTEEEVPALRARLRCEAWCGLDDTARSSVTKYSTLLSKETRVTLRALNGGSVAPTIATFLALSEAAQRVTTAGRVDDERYFSGRIDAAVASFESALVEDRRRAGLS